MTFWWDPEATPRSKFARDQGKTGEMMSDPPEAAALGWGGKDLAELGRRLGYDGAIFPRRDEMQVFDPNAIKEITPYETGGVHPNPRIAPNYVPAQLASGFRETSPGAIGRAMGRGTRVTRDRRDRQLSPTAVTAQNLLSEARPRYLHESTGSTFASGAFRTDARALLDHTAQRERDLVQRAFNEKLVNRMTVHDHEGTAIEAKNTTEMRGKLVAAGLNPDKYVLVHTQFPIQWFRAEHNSLEQMLHTIEELKKQGATETNPAVEAYLEKLQNTQAEAFIKSHWGAIKRNGVAVPKDFFDYQRAIAGVNDPFNNPFGNFYARMMHRWRNLTLAYMPRWALNTAAGSFLMAMTKGIVNPRDYLEGNRLERQGLLPAGINMRSLAPADFLEPGGIGYQDIGDVRFPTRDIYHRVQSIEDFFRRAGFVQSLRGQAKIQMRSIGEDLKSFYGELDDKPLIEQWLNDPKLVQRAVADVNKFSYAFGELSPFERRYVRQFIPFWGWYKFITKFAWRLPVDYPGRANIIQAFSSVGADAEHDVGKMPEWIQGSILLNLVGGKLHYMTALGINPLAQFANPARGFGGLLQLSQGSPAIQMILAGAGIDTLRGGTVPISPQEHVGKGSFGDLRDTRTGQLVNPATRGGFRRVIMAALRSIPEARIAERVYEGGPTYPESVPLLADRPMPPTKSTQPPSFMEDVVLPYLGVNLKTYDLANYQRLTKKQLAAAQKSAKRDLNRIKHGR